MTEQEETIARMGELFRGLHVDKNDPGKDDKYWQNFALACERRRAEVLGMQQQFDDALATGQLKDIRHSMTVAELIDRGAITARVRFAMGLALGAAITGLLLG